MLLFIWTITLRRAVVHTKNQTWKTVPLIWIAITFLMLLGRSASADEPMSPEDYCWQQQVAFVDEGVEMPAVVAPGRERAVPASRSASLS